MDNKKLIAGSYNIEKETIEEMEMILSLMQTGECIGVMDLGGKHYQLWDYKTSQQCKRPGDLIVGIGLCSRKYNYFFSISCLLHPFCMLIDTTAWHVEDHSVNKNL